MIKLFISHSSQDDPFVCELRAALADHGQAGWIDSRELRGGDPLWSEIQKAIDEASAYAVVISTDALQSKWVGKELRHALKVQKKRGQDKFPVIPLSLNDTKLGVLEEFFGEEPLYIPVTNGAGGVEAAMDAILVALGQRLPADVSATPQPKAEPLEELVLELTDLKFHEQDGVRRAAARARLVYEPATPGQPRSTNPPIKRRTSARPPSRCRSAQTCAFRPRRCVPRRRWASGLLSDAPGKAILTALGAQCAAACWAEIGPRTLAVAPAFHASVHRPGPVGKAGGYAGKDPRRIAAPSSQDQRVRLAGAV
ncbi:MAG: toll/interleukin-1 receptor domain-containing protein [Planctomycetota bacterium]|nr:toll/interleukin-1 receptor domain-containing protein [Planctomycetota bacterium]